MRPAADSIAALLTFIRRRFSMFEARQRGEKVEEASPILKVLHFTNIHRYLSGQKKTAGQFMGGLPPFVKGFHKCHLEPVFGN